VTLKKKKKNLFSKLAYKIKTNKKSRNGRLAERPYGHPGWRPKKANNNSINARKNTLQNKKTKQNLS